MKNYKERLAHITTFVFDVDGVLTDGTITLLPDGSMARTMNTRDGFAMQLAVKLGYTIAIITGGKDEMVKKRLQGLGITDIFLGIHDKIDCYTELQFRYSLQAENVLYMGDDIPDFEVMHNVGVACCPYDAVPEIRSISHYISPKKGGEGCVRDVIEQTLRLQNKWNTTDSKSIPSV